MKRAFFSYLDTFKMYEWRYWVFFSPLSLDTLQFLFSLKIIIFAS